MRLANSSLANMKQSLSLVALLVLVLVEFSDSQFLSIGKCPNLQGQRDFNVSRYAGHWYEVEKYWFVFEATASCVSVYYASNGDGTFGVEINMLDELTRTKMTMPGFTWFRSRDGSADFNLDLLITQSPLPFHFKYPYLVLDTDYETYTIKYRCKQIGLLSMQTMWILSRTRGLSKESRDKVYTFLRRNGLSTKHLRKSKLSTCDDIE